MRDARVEQRGGGRQLVVRGDERAAAVEDGDARRGEALERPETRLDPVERRQDVEASERDVAGAQARDRLGRRDDCAEARVRGRDAVGDYGEGAHLRECSGHARETEGPAARPLPDCFRLVTAARA